MSKAYRVGVDIGGTFTDLVLINEDGGDLRLHKLLTTPDDPARGAIQGLGELLQASGITLADCTEIVHGTTLVTNAIIERRGVRTALLTTRGFADILEMGREQRYDIYDLFLEYPEPLVPRRWRLEVDERVTRDGTVLEVPKLEGVMRQVKALVGEGVEAVAVSFLHSYRNPGHEREVAEQLRREFPQISVSISSEVAPEIREFERTSTTVANAYVQPLVDRYVSRLESQLTEGGFKGRFFLMQSSGGLAAPGTVRKYPIRLLESGPVGGALVAAFLGAAVGEPDVLAFDMGGTTAKACLVQDGRPDLGTEMEAARVHRFKRGSGISIKTPVVELMEIGAGGGSIARSDKLGLLRVGPESAGANPGPACYGRGGTQPTVTDACLVLGYLDPDYFLGGEMVLDPDASHNALWRLGDSLGLSTIEVAWGIYNVVCENMASAARVHIIEKGRDPRNFPMIASGGAGPITATRVSRTLGLPKLLIPPVSGVASALGFLVTPVSFEFSRSYPGELNSLSWEEVSRLHADMEAQASEILQSSGVEKIKFERWAEMRLSGQFHDIEVPVPAGELTAESGRQIEAAFRSEYERLFHSVLPGYEPMVINWRLRATGPEPRVRLDRASVSMTGNDEDAGEGTVADSTRALKSRRKAYFPESGGYVSTPVYSRYALREHEEIDGPAIIEEKESTLILNPTDRLRVDWFGNLQVKIGGKA